MSASKIKETDLYLPIKALLEGQGYEVKGEVGAADIVGVREQDDVVIVELKATFSLALFHQAIERQKITDHVYVAIPRGTGKPFLKALKNNINLCRRLGLGLITVRLKDDFSEIHIDPTTYTPRKMKPKKTRLLKEFAMRVGDPNLGGTSGAGGKKLMTAYRQDALRCLKALKKHEALKAALVAKVSACERARNIMADDHYGWFEKGEGLGVYQITPKGRDALKEYAKDLKLFKLKKLPD
ncbi:MAG: DUF2161 domain-containing phosphodiesterase [Nitratireductor sp.]